MVSEMASALHLEKITQVNAKIDIKQRVDKNWTISVYSTNFGSGFVQLFLYYQFQSGRSAQASDSEKPKSAKKNNSSENKSLKLSNTTIFSSK